MHRQMGFRRRKQLDGRVSAVCTVSHVPGGALTRKSSAFGASALLFSVVIALVASARAGAQTADNVVVVINDASPASQRVGEYYAKKRSVPPSQLIRIRTTTDEAIDRAPYVQTIEQPIGAALARAGLQDRVLYVVLTKGVPLRINGTSGVNGTVASVDSELTLLYRRLTGQAVTTRGRLDNPYFLGARDVSAFKPFTHRDHDVYLVTRLDAFTVDDVLALIDRGIEPQRTGRIVLDQQDKLVDRLGDDWLAAAAKRLEAQGEGARAVLETTPNPARGVSSVLGYFSWGSNDPRNRTRSYGMGFVPGALAGSFVSSDARTFLEPPANWVPNDGANPKASFAGGPQALIGDLIREGVTGVAGSVAEPYLQSAVRPDVLFPVYLAGANLAEAFYAAMPHLSWQGIVIGDPLAAPFRQGGLGRDEIDGRLVAATGLPEYFSKRRLAVAAVQSAGVPEQALELAIRGDGELLRGNRKQARALYEEAAGVAPRFVAALVSLSVILEADGERDAAIATYRRLLEVDPKNTTALNNLAYALAVYRKAPAEALPLAKRAAVQAPDDPTVLDTLAWVYYLTGDRDESVKVMQQVLRGRPANAEIRLHAAIIFAAAGARAVALDELALAVKLNPALEKSDEVRRLRQQLQPASQ